jgi:phosphohistidine phosphatase SixA
LIYVFFVLFYTFSYTLALPASVLLQAELEDFENIFLVRHGRHLHSTGNLTEDGKAQSENAAQELLKMGVGAGAVLLSSDAPRALQTSGIIASLFKGLKVMPSARMRIIGNEPDGVESLDVMLEAALSEADARNDGGGSLVVVTHKPLIEIATGGDYVDNGQVVPYKQGSWDNYLYETWKGESLTRILGEAGLY